MLRKTRFLALATILLPSVAALPALAQQVPPPTSPMMMNSSPADKALVSSMDRMNHGMAANMSGNSDQDFSQMMLAHHQGAVDMAKVELQYGKDPVLRKMAEDIIRTQNAEIKQLQAWQAKHPLSK